MRTKDYENYLKEIYPELLAKVRVKNNLPVLLQDTKNQEIITFVLHLSGSHLYLLCYEPLGYRNICGSRPESLSHESGATGYWGLGEDPGSFKVCLEHLYGSFDLILVPGNSLEKPKQVINIDRFRITVR